VLFATVSLAKSLAGRKRDSYVWEHFGYDEIRGKSTCRVSVGEDKVCGSVFTGKNTSNLVAHLQRSHKQEYAVYLDRERAKKESQQGLKRAAEWSGDGEPAKKVQTLKSCLQRRIVKWPADSQEYKDRIRSVMNMVIDTNLPLAVVDHASFKDMVNTLDTKFSLPGKVSCTTINAVYADLFVGLLCRQLIT